VEVARRIERYRGRVQELGGRLPELVSEVDRAALEEAAGRLEEERVPTDLALWVAGFDSLSRALDVVEAAEACGMEVAEAARAYFALGAALELDWLAGRIVALPTQDRWVAGARAAFRDDLFEHHRTLCVAVITQGMPAASAASRLDAWRHQNHAAVDAWLALVADLKSQAGADLAMLSVALRAVQKLAVAAGSRGAGAVSASRA
jgi:glutamate dehydrogenase